MVNFLAGVMITMVAAITLAFIFESEMSELAAAIGFLLFVGFILLFIFKDNLQRN